MSNMDATRVMGAAAPGAAATVMMPAGGDALRTQMGGTTTCPVCKSTTPLLDAYCGDCGYLLASAPAEELELPDEEAPAAELVDEQTSRRYRLRMGANTVGRQGTDVLCTDATVSRNHAVITVSETGILVEDLGSSNGTKVGDVRLQANTPVPARPGDPIRFGTWQLVLAAGAGAAAERTVVVPLDDKTSVIPPAETETAAASTQAAPPSGPPVAKLEKVEGICEDIDIPAGMISIGRKSGNAIVLADPYLSGRHVELFAEPDGVYMADIGSTNGTFVNGQKLEANDRQLLVDGDEVQLGQTKYRFLTVSAPEAASEPNEEHVSSLDKSEESAAE